MTDQGTVYQLPPPSHEAETDRGAVERRWVNCSADTPRPIRVFGENLILF